MQFTLGALSFVAAAMLATGCEYYVTRVRGASYFASRPYEYAEAFRAQPPQYMPPMARGGGPPTAAHPEGR